jgi:subtilase family serine protease
VIKGQRLILSLLTLVALVMSMNVVSQAQSQTLMTRHVREVTLNGQAQSVGRLPGTQIMHFDVVLALRHQPELENFLQELYDPSSSSYHRYVTPQEFTARFGPSQEDYDSLVRFAQACGFTQIGGSRDGMDLQFTGTVASIESAFHVTMNVYQHPTEKRTYYSPDREPTVNLPFQLWHISGLDNFSTPRPTYRRNPSQIHSNAVKGSCPSSSYCGSDMRAAYYGSGPLTGTGQTLGLLEFAGYDIADLNTYFKNVGQTDNVPVTGVSVGGASLNCLASQRCDDTEQIIDMTQAISMAPAMSALYVFVGNTDSALLSAMSTHSPLSSQLSSSWAWGSDDQTTDDPFFQKFAAQGQSYFQAAGDNGSYNGDSTFAWPGSSQYVISVGGTDLQTTKAGGPWSSETGWVDSGGGYLTRLAVPIPAWQQLTGVINSKNEGSTTLRNGPDVSAESNFDFYFCSDQQACETGLGGTSFAAPMWAGFTALINQQALQNGNALVGFINPAVYAIGVGSGYSAAFHDITSGNNGFPAVAGYDLNTGWGSPTGVGLINALAGSGGGGGGPVVSLSPTSLAWGKVLVGKTSGKKIVTVSNTGTGTLNITSIVASANFAIVAASKKLNCGATLAAGASCEFKVTFTPPKTGAITGTVKITDNASNSPQTVALSGTGK